MQTINLTKLKELPIPKSLDEKLLVSIAQDHLQTIIVNVSPSGEMFFDTEINSDWLYAHVKVTATETDFKVGDRVNAKGWRKPATIKAIDTFAIIEFEQPTNLPNYTTPLTDLP